MSSENQPPPSPAPPFPGPPQVRRAWTRHARSLSLRKYLAAALAVAVVVGGYAVWHARSPTPEIPAAAPDNAANTAAQNSTPVTGPLPEEELRQSQSGGGDGLILGPSASPSTGSPLGTPTIDMSPPPPSVAGGSAPAAVPDLPTVSIAPSVIHPVPSEAQTPSIGPVTLSDRNGNPVRVRPNAPPPPTYVPSVGPAYNPGGVQNYSSYNYTRPSKPPPAPSSNPPSHPSSNTTAMVAPVLIPPNSSGRVAPLVANPPVFSGRGRALGGIGLEVAGLKVRLFGVRVPDSQDRCPANNGGKPLACDAASMLLLQQHLAGHSIVACRVPPGQHGDPGAICLDEEGTDLGRFLVIEGYALADTDQSYDYLPAEGAARTAKRGLWRYR